MRNWETSQASLRAPDNVSIAGLDDIDVAAYQTRPPLTTRQSFAQMAAQAEDLLLEALSDKEPDQKQITIEPVFS